jgi:outer membrane protein OmpA-like peptidoglycan-associated protein
VNYVVLLDFEAHSAVLSPVAVRSLNVLVGWFQAMPAVFLFVSASVDESERADIGLAEARARVVADYLQSRGIEKRYLLTLLTSSSQTGRRQARVFHMVE